MINKRPRPVNNNGVTEDTAASEPVFALNQSLNSSTVPADDAENPADLARATTDDK